MAKCIPSIDEIKNGRVAPQAGEIYLLEMLNKFLDDTFYIYFQPLLNGDYPDIVVFKENCGIFIIEVKDINLNNYTYMYGAPIKDDFWATKNESFIYQNEKGSYKKITPMQQAKRYKRKIANLYSSVLLRQSLKANANFDQNKKRLKSLDNSMIHVGAYFHAHNTQFVYDFFHLKEVEQEYEVEGEKRKSITLWQPFYDPEFQPNKYISIYGNDKAMEFLKKIKNSLTTTKIKYDIKIVEKVSKEFENLLKPSYDMIEQSQVQPLTTLQKKHVIFNHPTSRTLSRLRGKAGSGKTRILAQKAINASNVLNGEVVLILCYNLSLRNKLRDIISKQLTKKPEKNVFYITNIHEFLRSLADRSSLTLDFDMTSNTLKLPNGEKITYSAPDNKSYTSSLLTELKHQFSQGGVENEDRHFYKAIFIDEYQDFQREWLDFIAEYVADKSGCNISLFADEKQNIYENQMTNKLPSTPVRGEWPLLKQCFRSGTYLNKLADLYKEYFLSEKYLIDDIDKNDEDELGFGLSGGDVYFVDHYDMDELFMIFRKLHTDKYNLNDISIIGGDIYELRKIDQRMRNELIDTMTNFETNEMYNDLLGRYSKDELGKKIEMIRKHKKMFFESNSGKVKISTIHSFKGLESSAVILMLDNGMNAELVYTGITRAKEVLYIISKSEKFNEFIKKFKIIENKIIFD